jgi:hypothetical protein
MEDRPCYVQNGLLLSDSSFVYIARQIRATLLIEMESLLAAYI